MIFQQPNWEELPRDAFRARVAEVVEQSAWVVDGNYARCAIWCGTGRHGGVA